MESPDIESGFRTCVTRLEPMAQQEILDPAHSVYYREEFRYETIVLDSELRRLLIVPASVNLEENEVKQISRLRNPDQTQPIHMLR
jgi:hypothetical protein